MSSATSSVTGAGPAQLRVPDTVASAMLRALLDNDVLGVALLRGGDWLHLVANPAYEAIVGEPAIGRRFADLALAELIPNERFGAVLASGRTARLPKLLLPPRAGDDAARRRFATLMLLPVRALGSDGDGVLILVRDASKEVHDERMAELFLLLARDMSVERDELATIRSAVAHAKEALGASAASIFLLSADGKSLHGALVGWDWTRSSFVTGLDQWPNVARAIAANRACHLAAEQAEGAEEGWFEQRGIQAATCAPMAADGRVVGVLFFDYTHASQPAVDLTLAKSVADQCALLVEREAARV